MDSMIEMARVWLTPFLSIKTRRDSSIMDIMKRVMEKVTTTPMETTIKIRDRLVFRTMSETLGRVRTVS